MTRGDHNSGDLTTQGDKSVCCKEKGTDEALTLMRACVATCIWLTIKFLEADNVLEVETSSDKSSPSGLHTCPS